MGLRHGNKQKCLLGPSHGVESGSHVPLCMWCEAFTCVRAGQSLWQAIGVWSRSLEVLGLFLLSSIFFSLRLLGRHERLLGLSPRCDLIG